MTPRLDGQAVGTGDGHACSPATGRQGSTRRASTPSTAGSGSHRSSSRPEPTPRSRQAVVIPTNSWQAYNFYDRDGDGWGDTWYAGGNPPVELNRPYLERGVPPRFRRYDLPFLRWLMLNDLEPDFLAEDDVDRLADG